jgi:hypothetical protein
MLTRGRWTGEFGHLVPPPPTTTFLFPALFSFFDASSHFFRLLYFVLGRIIRDWIESVLTQSYQSSIRNVWNIGNDRSSRM